MILDIDLVQFYGLHFNLCHSFTNLGYVIMHCHAMTCIPVHKYHQAETWQTTMYITATQLFHKYPYKHSTYPPS